jgi:Arc/MetJ family transcription regulator
MRLHVEIDDALVAKIDEIAGTRGRRAFVRSAIERAVDQSNRWSYLDTAAGSTADHGHGWDADAAGWVRQQRAGDAR